MLRTVLRPSLGLRATATAAPFAFPSLNINISRHTTTALRSHSLTSSSLFSTSARTQSRTHALRLRRGRSTTPLLFTTTLALSSGLLAPQFFKYPTHNDSGAGAADFSSTPYSHARDAKTPLSTDGGKTLNPAAIRQISTGAILGLGLGVVFSALSRMLVLVLGVGIVVWQYAARRGYNIVPVDRMQRYVKGVNLRSAINDNAAFKISFGLMFALTAFGEF